MPGGHLLGFPPGALPPSVSGAGPHPPPPGHPLPMPHPLSIKSEPREESSNNKHSEDLRTVRVKSCLIFKVSIFWNGLIMIGIFAEEFNVSHGTTREGERQGTRS